MLSIEADTGHVAAATALVKLATSAVRVKRELSRRTIWRAVAADVHVKQANKTETALAAALRPFFRDQVESAAKRLTSLSNPPGTANKLARAIFKPSVWYVPLVNRTLPVLARGASQAMVAQMTLMGIDPHGKRRKASSATDWLDALGDDPPPGVVAELPAWMQDEISALLQETFAQDYWGDIAETTLSNIETVLRNGIIDGLSIPDMAASIRAELNDEYYHGRSVNIARTESGSVLNGSRRAAMDAVRDELGPDLPMSIAWLSVLGTTTRATHADLDGVPAGRDGMWLLGGVRVPWPGHYSLPAGERCGCQCSLVSEFGLDENEAQGLIDDYMDRVDEFGGGETLFSSMRRKTTTVKFDENQPRDDQGRWSNGSGGLSRTDENTTDTTRDEHAFSSPSATSRIGSDAIRQSKELSGGVNAPVYLEYRDEHGMKRALFKPNENEYTVYPAFPAGTLASRELAAGVVDRAMGLGMVPGVVMADVEGHGEGVLQEWVNDNAVPAVSLYDAHVTSSMDEISARGAVEEMDAKLSAYNGVDDMLYYDALIGNGDRHLGNWLVKDDAVRLIDHGYAFGENRHYYAGDERAPRFRTIEAMSSNKSGMVPMSGKFRTGLNTMLRNRDAVDGQLADAGLSAASRESFWRRASYLQHNPIGFGETTLHDLAYVADHGKMPWD